MEENCAWGKIVGENIKRYRERVNMTQKELAEITGISEGYISQLERGRDSASEHLLYLIAEAVGVTPDRLLLIQSKERERTINNIYEFLLALPLIDPNLLSDSLQRIGGNLVLENTYALDQMSYCYRRVPDSDAKKYVDFMLASINKGEDFVYKEFLERAELYSYYNAYLECLATNLQKHKNAAVE